MMHDTAIDDHPPTVMQAKDQYVGKLNENEFANQGRIQSSLIYIASYIYVSVREVKANCITNGTGA